MNSGPPCRPETKADREAVAAIVASLERVSVSGIRFQREAWTSMRLSLHARRVAKTTNYERMKAAMMTASSLPGYPEQTDTAVMNAERMIEAAASGQPFASDRGTFYVTEELVDGVLAGLEGSLHRFQRLANPIWIMDVDERRYADAHVRILWDGPFNREIDEITLEGGRRGTIRMLQSRLSEREFVQLGFTQFEGQWAEPEAAAINVARAALEAMGVRKKSNPSPQIGAGASQPRRREAYRPRRGTSTLRCGWLRLRSTKVHGCSWALP